MTIYEWIGGIILLDIRLNIPIRIHKAVPFLLLGLLLFLRFPFLISAAYGIKMFAVKDIFSVYLDCTYILSAALIWWEKDRLIEFHIGIQALCLFIFIPILKPVVSILLSTYTPYKHNTYSWIQFAAAAALGLSLIISKGRFTRMKLRTAIFWIAVSIAVGLATGAIWGFVYKVQNNISGVQSSLLISLRLFFIQLSNAAIAEEPLFRGFIWGYLKWLHVNEYWIWLIQAGLFCLGHIYYLNTAPYSFFIAIPAMALIFGFIAWRSRSISSSMIIHGLYNSFSEFVAYSGW